ncbi:MAG TPA: hypothetical protein VJO53_01640 [Candidatus Acidoferrales bacterium]|nr:hypothetical protein [Candidatus Acidoferrales bacterium]
MVSRTICLLVLSVLAVPAATRACTCPEVAPGKCPGLQNGDVVFVGTVTAAEDISNAGLQASVSSPRPADVVASRVMRYHFQIEERFAGVSGDTAEIDIFSGGEDGDCGYRFKTSGRYLVFTHRGNDGRAFATICDGTRPASDAQALLPQLRAMRDGKRVASVFGVLRRADPPFLAAADDPDGPLPKVSLRLRSRDDRFETSTDSEGIFSFYDVHAGEYEFMASQPVRIELTNKTLLRGRPVFKIPNGACYEFDVDALPTGHIQGSVLGPNGRPIPVAAVELYRAGSYEDSRPGLWGFQGAKGVFDFDHVGPGEYIIVFNRTNRMNPNSPFHRAFYPGVAEASKAQPITLKDGQELLRVNMKVIASEPTRQLRVRLKWRGRKPEGNVTVVANTDRGDAPVAQEVGDGRYELTLFESANYTISAWEDLTPRRASLAQDSKGCAAPARIVTPAIAVSGSDPGSKSDPPPSEVVLTFSAPDCTKP